MICDICGDSIGKRTRKRIKEETPFVGLCDECYKTFENSDRLLKEEDEFVEEEGLYPEFSI